MNKTWRRIRLGELVTFQRGYDLPLNRIKEGKYPIVASNGIIGYHNEFKARGPGVTIGRSGNLGKPFFLQKDYWPHNTTLYSLEFHNSDPKFVYYFLKTLNLGDFNAGSAVPTLNRNHIHPIQVIVPSDIEEQRHIGDLLYSLDEQIQLNQQMNKTLEAIGQALFKHWFIDFEFPNEKGKPYKSSGGEMVDSELGEIPKGWKVLKMEAVVAEKKFSIVDGPFGTQLHSEEYVEEGIPVIRVVNLSFEGKFERDPIVYITEEKFESLTRSAIYPGDILLAKTGATIGKLARCPSFIKKGIVASSVMRISPHPERSNKHFLYNIIKILSEQKYWESISGGSTRPTINIPDVKFLEIIYPSDDLMKKYHTLVDPLYSKMEINDQGIFYLSGIRDKLLPRLMSGKIRVGVERTA